MEADAGEDGKEIGMGEATVDDFLGFVEKDRCPFVCKMRIVALFENEHSSNS